MSRGAGLLGNDGAGSPVMEFSVGFFDGFVLRRGRACFASDLRPAGSCLTPASLSSRPGAGPHQKTLYPGYRNQLVLLLQSRRSRHLSSTVDFNPTRAYVPGSRKDGSFRKRRRLPSVNQSL